MARPPDLWLPRPRRWSTWAIAISATLHVLLLFVKIRPWLVPPRRPPSVIVLLPPGAEGRPQDAELRFQVPGGAARRGQSVGIVPREEPVIAASPEVRAEEPVPEPVPLPPPIAEPVPRDSARPPGVPVGRNFYIGPALGEGKLWVRPLPAPPREIAEALAKSHFQLVDSAVSAIVQTYIDSVLNAPAPPGAALPSWTTQLFGKTFGIDSKYIYIAGLKIPSAVLALLPIRGGMTMEYSQAARLATIREDLSYAAQRSATLDDFKRAVRELRAERERQRQLELNQRGGAKADTGKREPARPIP